MNRNENQGKSALPNLNTVSPTLIPPIPAPVPAPKKTDKTSTRSAKNGSTKDSDPTM